MVKSQEINQSTSGIPQVSERPQWQRFLERRSSWPLDEERLRQGQVQPQEGMWIMWIRVPAVLSFAGDDDL